MNSELFKRRIVRNVALVACLILSTSTAIASCPSTTSQESSVKITLQGFSSEGSRGGPQIDVLQIKHSEDDSKLAAIGIRFRASPEAEIDYQSVQIFYGRLGVNITERIKQCFDLTQDILVTGAALPAGKHKLRIGVTDRLNRTSRIDLSVKVI
jgi:hypothetical protein